MLLFKRHLLPLIRSGQKRQTLRFWTRPIVKPNTLSHTPGLGQLLILAVEPLLSLSQLTEDDAHADGFPSLPALLAELTRIYGPTPPTHKTLYRITFAYPPTTTIPPPSPSSPSPASQSPIKVKPDTRPPRPRSPRQMTPTQRHLLKSHILAQAP